MNAQHTNLVSKKGMKELRKAVAQLERERHQIIQQLRDMDHHDGHDERLERIEKLSQLEYTETQLSEKQSVLSSAKLLPRKRDAFTVALGSVVELADMHGRLVRYTIVDSIEANPSDGRISVKSPLGKNLVGKRIQDVVEWSRGLSTNQLQLVRIM